jgi:hypothetical protein
VIEGRKLVSKHAIDMGLLAEDTALARIDKKAKTQSLQT